MPKFKQGKKLIISLLCLLIVTISIFSCIKWSTTTKTKENTEVDALEFDETAYENAIPFDEIFNGNIGDPDDYENPIPLYYKISNMTEFANFACSMAYGNTFKGFKIFLMTDLDFSTSSTQYDFLSAKNFQPLGSRLWVRSTGKSLFGNKDILEDTHVVFDGTFNGMGHTISNIKITNHVYDGTTNEKGYDGSNNWVGFFSAIGIFGKVLNLRIENMEVALPGQDQEAGEKLQYKVTNLDDKPYYGSCLIVGAIAGAAWPGAKISNCMVDGFKVYQTGRTDAGGHIVGGLVGGLGPSSCSVLRYNGYGDGESNFSGSSDAELNRDFLENKNLVTEIMDCHVKDFKIVDNSDGLKTYGIGAWGMIAFNSIYTDEYDGKVIVKNFLSQNAKNGEYSYYRFIDSWTYDYVDRHTNDMSGLFDTAGKHNSKFDYEKVWFHEETEGQPGFNDYYSLLQIFVGKISGVGNKLTFVSADPSMGQVNLKFWDDEEDEYYTENFTEKEREEIFKFFSNKGAGSPAGGYHDKVEVDMSQAQLINIKFVSQDSVLFEVLDSGCSYTGEYFCVNGLTVDGEVIDYEEDGTPIKGWSYNTHAIPIRIRAKEADGCRFDRWTYNASTNTYTAHFRCLINFVFKPIHINREGTDYYFNATKTSNEPNKDVPQDFTSIPIDVNIPVEIDYSLFPNCLLGFVVTETDTPWNATYWMLREAETPNYEIWRMYELDKLKINGVVVNEIINTTVTFTDIVHIMNSKLDEDDVKWTLLRLARSKATVEVTFKIKEYNVEINGQS